MKVYKNKVTVIGAGMVGSAVVNFLLNLNMIAEIVVIDNNENKALGESLDASHTTSFTYSPNVLVRTGKYEDCADSQIIIITAGPSATPNKPIDRLELAEVNVKVMNEVMKNITAYTKEAVIIIVTNPVDIVTYFAQKNFDYPEGKIIGSGTMLDTARFRRIIAERYLVDTKNVHGYILGEHGESAFASWSLVNIAGVPVDELNNVFGVKEPLDRAEVLNAVKTAGYEILVKKGYTNSGIAASVARLAKAILLNELSIIPVATTLQGEYGIKDVCLSVPCTITSEGVGKRIEVPLTEAEVENLRESATKLKKIIKSL